MAALVNCSNQNVQMFGVHILNFASHHMGVSEFTIAISVVLYHVVIRMISIDMQAVILCIKIS